MRTLGDSSVNLEGKRVFCRVDFNVPLTSEGEVADDERIVRALPTLKFLLERGAKVVVAIWVDPKAKSKSSTRSSP